MENDDTHLLDKTYIPYQEKRSTLSSDLALRLLSELGKSWIINVDGQLYKEYYFDNFIDAIKFANEVAEIAELQNHHPALEISWGKCKVKIWTHSINGLTENDFILAAKINSLLA